MSTRTQKILALSRKIPTPASSWSERKKRRRIDYTPKYQEAHSPYTNYSDSDYVPSLPTIREDDVSSTSSLQPTRTEALEQSDTDLMVALNVSQFNHSTEEGTPLCPEETAVKTQDIFSTTFNSPSPVSSFTHDDDSEEADTTAVHVSAPKKKMGKRVRNKKHSCYFCHQCFVNIHRHLVHMHSNEMEVAKLAVVKPTNEQKNGFQYLIRVGDFYHNTEVVSLKCGELILVRRPTEIELASKSYLDYGPCPSCLGFLLKKNMWLHVKKCVPYNEARQAADGKHALSESNAIMNNVLRPEINEDFVTSIATNLRRDSIGKCSYEDKLICKFGSLLFEKYGNTQCELIRQSMRQLGRLLLVLRSFGDDKEADLESFLIPNKFDILIEATKKLCITHKNITQRPEFGVPSLALKIGYNIKKCVALLGGTALRKNDLDSDRKAQNFLNLMELEWCSRISSNALSTLELRKLNSTQLLPLTSDILKLNAYVDQEIGKAGLELQKHCSRASWTRLARLVLLRLILFNKRRSGETSKMLLLHYRNRPDWSEQSTQELKQSLTLFEQQLAKRLSIVEICGKRGKKVAVILTPQAKEMIDLLICHRAKSGVLPANPYVFACTDKSLSHLRGHDCMRKIISEINLEASDRINATKLRKYVATVTQVLNLSENETDWLARHLGHDVGVHRDFYRLHENTVELTKISRLLIAVDKGEIGSFEGKQLKDINIEGVEGFDDSDAEGEDRDNTSSEEDDETLAQEVKVKQNVSTRVQVKSKRNVGRSVQKQAWTTKEKTVVLEYFRTDIKNGRVPGKDKCVECQDKYSNILSKRKWTDIKFCVKNQISKLRKMKNS